MKLLKKLFDTKHENGQAMAEAALVIPLFILILCGLLDFGWIFSNQLMINNCSREGARYAIVCSRDSDMISKTTDHILAIANFGDIEDITVDITKDSDDVSVSVTKDVKVLTPIAGIFATDQVIAINSITIMSVD